MSDTKTNGQLYTLTSPAILFYQNLFEARGIGAKGKERGTPKFDISIGLTTDHPDFLPLQKLAIQVARERWPGRDIISEAKAKPKTFKFPLSSGDDLAARSKLKGKDNEFMAGHIVIVSRSKYEPRLSAVVNGQIVDYNDDKRPAAKPYFYRGVSVLAQVNLVAYDGVDDNPDGVTAYLNMVCSLNKGEKIGGVGQAAADVFKGYVGIHSSEDPTGGAFNLDDEIPF